MGKPLASGSATDRTHSGSMPLSPEERLLGHRLFIQAMARFLAAGLMVGGAVVAHTMVGIEALSVGGLSLVALGMVLYNLWVLSMIGPLAPAMGEDRDPARRYATRRMVAHASIVLDFLALTVAIWFVGGVRSPFLAFYLLHIGIASILLTRRAAYFAAGLAASLLVGLVLLEMTGLLPPPRPIGAVAGDGPLELRFVATVFFVYLSLFGLIVLAQTQLAAALRRGEHAAEERALQAEKLGRMRRDFLHVAFHDVSSPIAGVEQLLRNLRDGLCGPLEARQLEQVERALAKLEGMEHLVRDVRLLSEIESTDLRAQSSEIPLALLLQSVVEEHMDAAKEKGLTVRVEPCERVAIAFGVPRLVREAIANYVTNAIKYTLFGGLVMARIVDGEGVYRIEVTDSGVGIAPEDRVRLFEEFARVRKQHPELKGVRGSGLGLSIVRRIAESHGGRVGVESAPGKGSTFWIELPAWRG